MMLQMPQAHNHGKYHNNEKDWLFQFAGDNKMSYKYFFLDHLNLGKFNTYAPYIVKKMGKVTGRTNYILQTLDRINSKNI